MLQRQAARALAAKMQEQNDKLEELGEPQMQELNLTLQQWTAVQLLFIGLARVLSYQRQEEAGLRSDNEASRTLSRLAHVHTPTRM